MSLQLLSSQVVCPLHFVTDYFNYSNSFTLLIIWWPNVERLLQLQPPLTAPSLLTWISAHEKNKLVKPPLWERLSAKLKPCWSCSGQEIAGFSQDPPDGTWPEWSRHHPTNWHWQLPSGERTCQGGRLWRWLQTRIWWWINRAGVIQQDAMNL